MLTKYVNKISVDEYNYKCYNHTIDKRVVNIPMR